MPQVLRFTVLIIDKPVPRTICFDENEGRVKIVGPYQPGMLIDLPPSCAEMLVRDGLAHVPTLEELINYLRKLGVKEESIQWLLKHVEKK